MERRPRHLRRLWNVLACVLLASSLAACGGGGGGGGGSSGPPGGGGPESDWLLAEFVAQDSNHQYVRVWDPAHPDVAVQDIQIIKSNGIVWTSSHLMFSDATSYDAATRTVRTLGHAKVFFDNDGKLYSIDLRGGHSHAPAQLSTITDVTTIAGVWPLDAAGDDAWVDARGGAHDWAVRATMASTDAAISILSIRGAMRDVSSGLPQYFFVSFGGQSGTAVQPTTFGVRTAAFAAVAQADVDAMDSFDDWLGPDPSQPGLAYLRIADQLRALRWTAAGVSVDADLLYSLDAGNISAGAVLGPDALYVSNSTSIVAVSNAQAHLVGQLPSLPLAMIDAGDYLAVYGFESEAPECCYVVEGVRKSDGAIVRLASGGLDVALLGATPDRIVVASAATAGVAPTFLLVAGDGTGATRLAGEWATVVVADTAPLYRPAPPVALVTCAPSADKVGYCGPGALTEVDIASGSSLAIGTLAPADTWIRPQSGSATVGLVFSLGGQTFMDPVAGFDANDTDVRDAWQFTPGVANSLARVTDNLP
jgi:hypothetical protein